SVFEGVVDEVDQGDLNRSLVQQCWTSILRDSNHIDRNTLSTGARKTHIHSTGYSFMDVRRFELIGFAPPFHARKIKNVVDEGGQTLTLGDNDLQILLLFFLWCATRKQHLAEHTDEGKRRLQFM